MQYEAKPTTLRISETSDSGSSSRLHMIMDVISNTAFDLPQDCFDFQRV